MKDVGKHSHSVCMLDVFMGYHQDSYPCKIEVGEPAPNLEEPSDWALDEIIGKTSSVGKLVESVEDPEDPGGGLEVTSIENPTPEHLPSLCSEGRTVDPITSSSAPRSRPPRKRACVLTDSSELRGFVLDSVRKIIRNEVPDKGQGRHDFQLLTLREEWLLISRGTWGIPGFAFLPSFPVVSRIREELEIKRSRTVKKRAHENP
ncbi:hypothetical protein L1987_42439 [Smallanthus sonchifolius]|uniref:Uncharacterized protein n=1 Tax=Smallanthus sonchifolius TaxID=185202 RepID=A0ACB9GIS6_9ASTR|nr:hypothetical protein L1987_42439 [Smallanthus sonchifolius]